MNKKKRLGDLLVQAQKISQKQLKLALEKQRETGIKLGQLLIEDNILTEEEMIEVLTVQLKIQRIKLEQVILDRKAVSIIPESLAKKYDLIGCRFQENKIVVAMADPLNIFASDDVHISTGFQVIPVIDTKSSIKSAIEKYYSSESVEIAAREYNQATAQEFLKFNDEKIEGNYNIKNAPVVKLINSIIRNAIKLEASDIHIEPFEDYLRIRYRIDGLLKEMLRVSKETSSAFLTRIKILAEMDISEKRVSQDGRIMTEVNGEAIDMRISTLPTVYGEKIVIRILKADALLINKDALGLTTEQINTTNMLIRKPNGIVLVTGPTGSGKTTTLYTLIRELNVVEKNIITVENPVEYRLEGVNQVNVNTKAGVTFAKGLKAILRQDPDVIMIGEIRDQETAQIAMRAAITGHLVLSTIHTNDTASAIIRLRDMGIEPYLISVALNGVVAQRLVRKICDKCKVTYEAGDYERQLLGLNDEQNYTLYKGQGCPYCSDTGYRGRTAIFEIMTVGEAHKKAIYHLEDQQQLKEIGYLKGFETITEACREKVLKGVTTIEEFTKITFTEE